MAIKTRTQLRRARHTRVRKRAFGTTERPRLAVFRSGKHIYAQIIDDTAGKTLAACSTTEKEFDKGSTTDAAEKVGSTLAERAKKAGVSSVVFDRGGFLYHGRIASLAEGARKGGLEF